MSDSLICSTSFCQNINLIFAHEVSYTLETLRGIYKMCKPEDIIKNDPDHMTCFISNDSEVCESQMLIETLRVGLSRRQIWRP